MLFLAVKNMFCFVKFYGATLYCMNRHFCQIYYSFWNISLSIKTESAVIEENTLHIIYNIEMNKVLNISPNISFASAKKNNVNNRNRKFEIFCTGAVIENGDNLVVSWIWSQRHLVAFFCTLLKLTPVNSHISPIVVRIYPILRYNSKFETYFPQLLAVYIQYKCVKKNRCPICLDPHLSCH